MQIVPHPLHIVRIFTGIVQSLIDKLGVLAERDDGTVEETAGDDRLGIAAVGCRLDQPGQRLLAFLKEGVRHRMKVGVRRVLLPVDQLQGASVFRQVRRLDLSVDDPDRGLISLLLCQGIRLENAYCVLVDGVIVSIGFLDPK